MAKTSPGQFFRQVKQEISKVVWPTRQEAGMSTLMVVVMTAMASVFFFLVDQIFGWGIMKIFEVGN